LTSIADTRFLLTLEFPPTIEIGKTFKYLFEKELKKHLLVPSIVLTEFMEIAGTRIGKDAAKTRIRLLEEKGMRIVALDEEHALIAGDILLSHRNIPIADALIASTLKTEAADYIITDDPHFKTIGTKTKWL
jgi:predicted nucleic acid-binding protein